jgi:ATPase family protein associated with various cellular activities (AAA)
MLTYFDTTAVRSLSQMDQDGRPKIVGWTHDRPRHPVQAYRWTSALAVLALERISRMLDKRINTRVLRHFAVVAAERRPPEALKLNDLCYADFGIASCAPTEIAVPGNHRQSVASFLERMHAHVLGIGSIPGYGKSCYSLILFGPPGTGKTTLVEAVAASSKADLVQITPSDFLLEGEAFVERRARLVFRALSCLTRCVILFDEFEQILRSRDQDLGGDKRSVFSFLTPGMLPKLKELNNSASKRRTVYCLITNHIGSLDNAAMRAGRFDHKRGILAFQWVCGGCAPRIF